MAKVFTSAVTQTVVMPNEATFLVDILSLAIAGTAQQFPSISIPDGKELVIRASASNAKKRVFIANSSANAADATKRMPLIGGEAVALGLKNANAVWFDGEEVGLKIEVMIEQ